MLTKNEIVEGLKIYNDWRRGADIEQMNPTDIGQLIDGAINLLERSDNSDYEASPKLPSFEGEKEYGDDEEKESFT